MPVQFCSLLSSVRFGVLSLGTWFCDYHPDTLCTIVRENSVVLMVTSAIVNSANMGRIPLYLDPQEWWWRLGTHGVYQLR